MTTTATTSVPSDAIMCEWVHKPGAMRIYAEGFLRAGLRLHDAGVPAFGSDDVPDEYQPGPQSSGIAGSVVAALRSASVIEDNYIAFPLYDIRPGGRRKSRRATANGRTVPTYRLRSRAAAVAALAHLGVVEMERDLFDNAEHHARPERSERT